MPVLLAALASVPAVFLTLLDEPARSAGTLINTLSGAVIVAEVVVLFAVSDDKWGWLRRNPGRVALGAAVVAAVIFAVGPLQLLRLTKTLGALRILRASKLLTAGRILRQRAGLQGPWQQAVGVGLTVLTAVFVALVLSDPTSHSRRVLDGALHWLGVTGVILAGAVLAIATYVLRTARQRGRRGQGPGRDAQGRGEHDAQGLDEDCRGEDCRGEDCRDEAVTSPGSRSSADVGRSAATSAESGCPGARDRPRAG